MKKVMLVMMLMISVFLVVSCDDLEVSDVDRLGIEGLSFLTYFREGEEILLDQVSVVAYGSDSQEPLQTLAINSNLIVLEGDGFVENGESLYLNTESAGQEYTLTVSYGGVSITLKYTVVEDYILVGQSDRADYPTIASALAVAAVNETIVVEPGTYSENVLVTTAGISLMASGNVILDTGAVEGEEDYGVVLAANDVLFDGFTIRNTSVAIVVQGATGVTVSNNVVSGITYHGIAVVQNADEITVEANTINQVLGYGIVIGYTSGGAHPSVTTSLSIVKDNVINGAGESGIYADVYSNHNEYVGNVISNAQNGIHLYKSNSDLVEDNTITNSSANGIALMGSSDNMIQNNTIMNNHGYGIKIKLSTGTGDPTPNGNNTLTGNTISNNNLDVLEFGSQIFEAFSLELDLEGYTRNTESNNDFGSHVDPIYSEFDPEYAQYAMESA